MKKGTMRTLSLILVCVLAAVLSACTPTDSQTTASPTDAPTTAPTAAQATATPEPEEPMDLSYVSWNCGAIVDDNWAELKLEELFNVKITTAKVDLSQTQARDLMLASGEFPDCGWLNLNNLDLYNQGITRTISKDMIVQYAPNYAMLLDSEPLGWKLNICPDDGNYMALTGYQAGNTTSATYMSAYRLDWLETLGLAPQGLTQLDTEGRLYMTTEPFTKSELLDILEGFTNGDPDGNGENDTFGIIAGGRDQFCWYGLYGIFGFSPNGTVNVDGRAENYYVTEQYKEFLRFAAELYAEGYLDQEFATIDRNVAWEKYASGRAGYGGTMAAWVGLAAYAQLRPPMSIINQTTDGKMLVGPCPVNDDGTGGVPPYSNSNYTYSFDVNAAVDDEKLVRILQIFDYCNFDAEAMIYLRYGEEGTHFTYTGEDGKTGPAFIEGITNGGEFGLGVYNSNYIAPKAIKELSYDAISKQTMAFAFGEYTERLIFPYRLDLLNETNLNELNTTYGSTINTLVDEFFYNVIGGEVDLDAEWDSYIETLNDAGYSQISEELQKAPLYADLIK